MIGGVRVDSLVILRRGGIGLGLIGGVVGGEANKGGEGGRGGNNGIVLIHANIVSEEKFGGVGNSSIGSGEGLMNAAAIKVGTDFYAEIIAHFGLFNPDFNGGENGFKVVGGKVS